jgi:hypothetical protein
MTHDTWSSEGSGTVVYLHEIVDTIPGQEERYMTSVLANSERARWLGEAPPAVGDRTPIQVGLFRTAEVSGIWPKVINMWGESSWERMINAFELQFAGDNTALEDWWLRNLTLRRRGYDRVLLPVSFCPPFTALRAPEMKGRAFVHLIEYVKMGQAPDYVARMEEVLLPAAKRLGAQLVGAYRIGFRPREVLTMWGMERWQTLAGFLGSDDPGMREWAAYREQNVVKCDEMVVLPGRINPLYLRAEGA